MKADHFILTRNEWVPNNARLPVIRYREAIEHADRLAELFETLFEQHGWPPDWRDGIYDYHHYHSTTHEALGIASGSATLVLGGPHGRQVDVVAGDGLVLPAGTGHCCIKASDDFLVVGAYPDGFDWDVCCKAPSPADRTRIDGLPIPTCDPFAGINGPLFHLWRQHVR